MCGAPRRPPHAPCSELPLPGRATGQDGDRGGPDAAGKINPKTHQTGDSNIFPSPLHPKKRNSKSEDTGCRAAWPRALTCLNVPRRSFWGAACPAPLLQDGQSGCGPERQATGRNSALPVHFLDGVRKCYFTHRVRDWN